MTLFVMQVGDSDTGDSCIVYLEDSQISLDNIKIVLSDFRTSADCKLFGGQRFKIIMHGVQIRHQHDSSSPSAPGSPYRSAGTSPTGTAGSDANTLLLVVLSKAMLGDGLQIARWLRDAQLPPQKRN